MGVALSCSLDDDLESNIEAVLVRTISFEEEEVRHPLQSFSFNGHNAEHSMMRTCGSRRTRFDTSCSFKGRELESALSFKTPFSEKENMFFGRADIACERSSESPLAEHGDRRNSCETYSRSPLAEPRNQMILYEKYARSPLGIPNERTDAAVRLQKVYKSFRTRRQLADCAVVAEQKWWKVLDFAELKRSSISFFEVEKPETAFSRWSRARTRAAKVGKGLSKDEKARKLALQHWLEAIDPRHRYGHNLQFYYVKWLHCHSKQPFFYWLDIGEGREVNLERCPRTKLQQQCIKYLGPAERKDYEVVIENGKFVYKQSRNLIDSTQGPKDVKWIFVLSTSQTLYIGQKKKGNFQHSSFLAGGATLSAGRVVIANGTLQAVWPHSGHYLPTEENFEAFMDFLEENNVDLTNVKRSPSEEGEEDIKIGLNSNSLDTELSQVDEHSNTNLSAQENSDSRIQDTGEVENLNQPLSRFSRELCSKVTKLETPRTDVFDIFKKDTFQPSCNSHPPDTPDEGYETAEESFIPEEEFMFPKANLFDDDIEDEHEEPIPREKIMRRINSHKGYKSYQLAQQLSSKWSTGAGPRISCMRDYPSELQFRILEHANLSPRHSNADGTPRNVFRSSPRLATSMSRGTARRISSLAPEVFMSKQENARHST